MQAADARGITSVRPLRPRRHPRAAARRRELEVDRRRGEPRTTGRPATRSSADVFRTRLAPVEKRVSGRACGRSGPLLDRTLQPFLADREVVAGLAECLAQRAEGVPVEDFEGIVPLRRSRSRAVGMRPSSSPSSLSTRNSSLGGEPPRTSPPCAWPRSSYRSARSPSAGGSTPLRRPRTRACRRASQPLGAGAQLFKMSSFE